MVHNLFLIYLSISTHFGRLCARHQEKQLCYSVGMTVWYAAAYTDHCPNLGFLQALPSTSLSLSATGTVCIVLDRCRHLPL